MAEKKEKKVKMYRVTRDNWMLLRRDQKAKAGIKEIALEIFERVKIMQEGADKKDLKRIALELFDKVKNWK